MSYESATWTTTKILEETGRFPEREFGVENQPERQDEDNMDEDNMDQGTDQGGKVEKQNHGNWQVIYMEQHRQTKKITDLMNFGKCKTEHIRRGCGRPISCKELSLPLFVVNEELSASLILLAPPISIAAI